VAVRRRRRRESEAVELAAARDGELAGAASPRTASGAAAACRREEEEEEERRRHAGPRSRHSQRRRARGCAERASLSACGLAGSAEEPEPGCPRGWSSTRLAFVPQRGHRTTRRHPGQDRSGRRGPGPNPDASLHRPAAAASPSALRRGPHRSRGACRRGPVLGVVAWCDGRATANSMVKSSPVTNSRGVLHQKKI